MKRLVSIGLLVVTLLATVQISLAQDRGVTDTSITVGLVADYTGPIAGWGQDLILGAKMYFQSVNDAGGIYGRKLSLVTASDNYQPAQAVAGAKKLIARDKVFAFICSLGLPTVSMVQVLEEDKTPLVGAIAANKVLVEPPKRYFFMSFVTHFDQARLMAKYPIEILKLKSPKMYAIFQDDDFGMEDLAGIDFQLKKYNMKLLGTIGFKRGNIDFSSQLARAKEVNANVVFLASCYVTTAQMLKEANQMGWKPLFIAPICSLDSRVVTLAGKDAAEGLVLTGQSSPEDKVKNKPMQEFIDMLAKYHPGKKPTEFIMQGFNGARILCEGIRRTGKNLTREKFVEAMETFKNFEIPLGGGLTYSPTKRTGPKELKYYEVKDGALTVVHGWTTPD